MCSLHGVSDRIDKMSQMLKHCTRIRHEKTFLHGTRERRRTKRMEEWKIGEWREHERHENGNKEKEEEKH